MRKSFIAGVAALALAAGMGAVSTGVSSAQTVNQACATSGYDAYYSVLQATCQVTASTQLSPPNTVFVLPPDSTVTPVSCQGVSSSGYTTQGTVTAAPPNLYAYNAGQPVCQFSVTSGIVPGGSSLGSETVNIASPAPGGSVQLNTYLCGDPSCATGTLNPYGPPAPPTLVTINNGGVVSNSSSTPDYNIPNRCFHVAGAPDPC
jgi:hypothetical protein